MMSLIMGDRIPKAGQTLKDATEKVGSQLQSSVVQSINSSTGGLSYDTLIQGFMAEGEGSVTAPLDFTSVEIWDYNNKAATLKTYPQGRCVLTNQRLMLMSCEPSATAEFTTMGRPAKGNLMGGVQLQYNAKTAVWYHPIPLANFRSIEMMLNAGSSSTGEVKKKIATTLCCTPRCEGWCSPECCLWVCCISHFCPICCENFYDGQQTMVSSVNERYVELNFEGAAWQDKKVLRINISLAVSHQAVQLWAGCIQARGPKLRGDQAVEPVAAMPAASSSLGHRNSSIGDKMSGKI